METKGSECLIISLSNYFIELVGVDFVAWTQQSHSGGAHIYLMLFGYYNSSHLNICKFATNFKNITVLESGRPASKLDVTYLKKLQQSSMTGVSISRGSLSWEFQISHLSPYPPSLLLWIYSVLQWPANVRHPSVILSVDQEPREDVKRPGFRLKLASAIPPFNLEGKGVFILDNPNDPIPFGHSHLRWFQLSGTIMSPSQGWLRLEPHFQSCPLQLGPVWGNYRPLPLYR